MECNEVMYKIGKFGEKMELVKFVAISDKKNIIKFYEYVEGILIDVCNQGYADDYQIDAEEEYPTVFLGNIDKDNVKFDIIFEFETYRDISQLTVDIYSDNYSLNIDNAYLENLKLYIKELIIKDWKKIVWLYDDDAYILSKDLYSRFYVTENSIRRFINEFMVKTFGSEWWELLSDQTIKDKYKARFKGYKTIVPGFNNVDDHLLSIDVGDLFKILTMKRLEWSPVYSSDIEKLLVGITVGNEHKIAESLKKQLIVKEDFWDKYFMKYFDDDFNKYFKEFEANRNHVAHNKILDRKAYKSIRRSIDKIDEYMESALKRLYSTQKPLEQVEAERKEYEELLIEAKQNDAGVTIRNANNIIEEFRIVLEEKYSDIIEALRFREDIEIGELEFDENSYSGTLFSAKSKVTNEQLDFRYAMDITDEEGAESTLTITCEQYPFGLVDLEYEQGFRVNISYINGAVEYDDEQGYYMPTAYDDISECDIDNYVDKMVEFINLKLENLRDYVESIRYETVKGGGDLPIASNVYCDECDEEYICIDENMAEIGTCLNCGAHNMIAQCERCGQYYNDYEDDDIKLCDSCKEHYEEE